MADRSEPLVVTPQACPFVALDHDRDRRLAVPDPMHRCFAEATAKARSLGHQANYCLTSAFTGCPIFLDWASRVAAEVITVPTTTGATDASGGTGAAVVASGATDGATPGAMTMSADGHATGTVTLPPSLSSSPEASGPSASMSTGAPLTSATPRSLVSPSSSAVPTTQSHPVPAPVPAAEVPVASAPSTMTTPPMARTAPPIIAEAALPPDPFERPMGRTARVGIDPGPATPTGSVGSAAPAGSPGRPMGTDTTGAHTTIGTSTAPLDGVTTGATSLARAGTLSGVAAGQAGDDTSSAMAAELDASMTRTDLAALDPGDGSSGGGTEGDGDLPPWSRGRQRVPMDAGAPSSLAPQTRPAPRATPREWETGRRFAAYSAARTPSRLGRPALVAIGAILVAVLALALFLLPSMFLGAAASPSPTPPSASGQPGVVATQRPAATPAASGAATPRPEPTNRSYRVKSGDTLLRIGRRFGLTVDQLVCANKIRNPNALSVGATLTIPPDSYQCPKPTKKPKG